MADTYRLLDSGRGKKLERLGKIKIIRPCSASVWEKRAPHLWQDVAAEFQRHKSGDGSWSFTTQLSEDMTISVGNLKFKVKFTPFGHLGIFPEQQQNWQILQKISAAKKIRILNLFGYTGGATLSCALGGAQVTHVDASKTTIAWAKENAQLNSCVTMIRWLTDDVRKFLAREIRRRNFYDAVILDPPSFGRGTKGEIWKFEEHIAPLLTDIKKVTGDKPYFILLTTHTPGITATSLQNLLRDKFPTAKLIPNELTIEEQESERFLPAGMGCLLVGDSVKL